MTQQCPATTLHDQERSQWSSASRAASRSSSAQTSAMRPEIRRRDPLAGCWPASTTCKTRNGRGDRKALVCGGCRAKGATTDRTLLVGGSSSLAASNCAGLRGLPQVVLPGCPEPGCAISQCQRARRGATNGDGVCCRLFMVYIIMVLRIRPTARPSISKGSPGSTTMVW